MYVGEGGGSYFVRVVQLQAFKYEPPAGPKTFSKLLLLLLLLLLLQKNWRAAGLELTTIAPSRTIVTDGNC